MRADRLEREFGELYMVFESNLETILQSHIPEVKPDLVIIDSLHTVSSSEIPNAVGSVNQLNYCESHLRGIAKSSGIPFLIVGQVTKEGDVAGSNALKHNVDAVLYLDGDKQLLFRLLRSEKNRFGNIGEVGVFEMTGRGLIEVPNPSAAFLAERSTNAPGSAVAVTMEGNRAILVEMQALTTPAQGTPSRRGNGVNNDRAQMIVSVITKYINYVRLGEDNILMSAVGGMVVTEPAADLALAVALTSSWHGVPVPADIIAVGEIGLTGEIRNVPHLMMRLRESFKQGFTKAVIPPMLKKIEVPSGMKVYEARTLDDALRYVFAGRIAFDRPPQRAASPNNQRNRRSRDDEEDGREDS